MQNKLRDHRRIEITKKWPDPGIKNRQACFLHY